MATVMLRHPQAADLVCRDRYGDESGYVEALLDANPGLAAAGRVLPAGTVVSVPLVAQAEATVPVVTLWD